eukprot:TRINITY_DN1944_c0_g1_i6.p1 TRINITY_DN1944_c0_g1~~TRINITY_DN1944_c0_g1_i6.p1  ORF type:complete len:275 (+),score=61.82 TRINITY_DN1944_c0_g1_i6:2266-3090(+)
MMCIPKEEHIKLRYLLVFNTATAISASIITDNMELKEHYYNYIGKLKAKDAIELQKRIAKRIGLLGEEAKLSGNKGAHNMKEAKVKSSLGDEDSDPADNFDKEDKKKGDVPKVFVSKLTGQPHTKLWNEYTSLVASDNLKVSSVSVKDDCCVWRVIIDTLRHSMHEGLRQDFARIRSMGSDREEIEFELRFTDNYPMSPPLIRVVKPRLKTQGGIVAEGGRIGLDILRRENWAAETSMETLLINILAICFEEARIDMERWNVEYNMKEVIPLCL